MRESERQPYDTDDYLSDLLGELRSIRKLLESVRGYDQTFYTLANDKQCRSCGTEHGTAFKCPDRIMQEIMDESTVPSNSPLSELRDKIARDGMPELVRRNADGTIYDKL